MVKQVVENLLRLLTVHDRRTGIDIGLDRIRLDQFLAKAVDGRACQLVERDQRLPYMFALLRRQPGGQCYAHFGRNPVLGKHRRKFPYALQQFAGGQLGKRDGRNLARRHAAGQQHGNPSRHDGGLT